MRTKTLLLTGALSLAGAAAAMAQAVYSVNAVGYVNTTVSAGFNMIANPLTGPNQSVQTVAEVLPSVPDGSAIYKYENGAYGSMNGFESQFGGWGEPTMTLPVGLGFFFFMPPGTPDKTLTFVGEVPQGHLVTPLPAGFAMVSSQVPQTGKVTADLLYPAVAGDVIYTYGNKTGYDIYGYEPAFGGWQHGEVTEEPVIAVGQGFWSLKLAAKDWVRDFNINNP